MFGCDFYKVAVSSVSMFVSLSFCTLQKWPKNMILLDFNSEYLVIKLNMITLPKGSFCRYKRNIMSQRSLLLHPAFSSPLLTHSQFYQVIANKLLGRIELNFLEVFLSICHYAPASSISAFSLLMPLSKYFVIEVLALKFFVFVFRP